MMWERKYGDFFLQKPPNFVPLLLNHGIWGFLSYLYFTKIKPNIQYLRKLKKLNIKYGKL